MTAWLKYAPDKPVLEQAGCQQELPLKSKLTGAYVLDEAKSIVYGPRQHQYGHPAVNFQRIADAWAPIFGHKVSVGEVGLALMQLKLMRAVNQLHQNATEDEIRDTFVDVAGYSEATMRALFEEAP